MSRIATCKRGKNYDLQLDRFPDILFMTKTEFHLKPEKCVRFCKNVTIGVAAAIDSYPHLHTKYVLHQGLRKNKLDGSWDVVPLQFVHMSNSPVPPYSAIPPVQPQTCIFNALTNMVQELKGIIIKVQTNLSSYKTVPFPAVHVWS